MVYQVANWSKYQHYKDRNPPWIKLHHRLLQDFAFMSLSHDSKGLLIMLWVIASESDGKIEMTLTELQFRLFSPGLKMSDLQLLVDKGFLIDASTVQASASNTLADASTVQANACAIDRDRDRDRDRESEEEEEEETKKDMGPEAGKPPHSDPDFSKPSKRFKPPTRDEVVAYCTERHNGVNADTFLDFYSSKGWKVGKNPMVDWKAAVRTWEKSRTETPEPPRNAFAGYRSGKIAFQDDPEGGIIGQPTPSVAGK